MDEFLLVVRVLVGLGVVFAAIFYLQRRLAKRGGTTGREELIRVVGRKGVGAKAQVVVVDIADQRYVLGVTEAGVSVVDTMAAPEPQHEPVAEAADSTSEDHAHSGTMTTTPATGFASILAGKQAVPFGAARPSLLSLDTWVTAARQVFARS